jgi:hypothetical protein
VQLAVTGINGETGIAPPPPPPAGSESATVSTFDDLKVAAAYGSWTATSDAMNGGKSKISIDAVEHGAKGSKGALHIAGELIAGSPFLWAGALYAPGAVSGAGPEPVNLSSKKTISFWAKGDGKSYALAVMTERNAGQMPAMQIFAAGPEWKQYSFPMSAFGTDGSDLSALIFAHAQAPGKFEFEIDELEMR